MGGNLHVRFERGGNVLFCCLFSAFLVNQYVHPGFSNFLLNKQIYEEMAAKDFLEEVRIIALT